MIPTCRVLRVDRDVVAQTAPAATAAAADACRRSARMRRKSTSPCNRANPVALQCRPLSRGGRAHTARVTKDDATRQRRRQWRCCGLPASDTRTHSTSVHARERTLAIITSHTGCKVYKPTPGGWLLGGSDGGDGGGAHRARRQRWKEMRWRRRRPGARAGFDSQTWREDGMFGLSREPRGIRGTAGTENGAGR